jgi:hypothetical protein
MSEEHALKTIFAKSIILVVVMYTGKTLAKHKKRGRRKDEVPSIDLYDW